MSGCLEFVLEDTIVGNIRDDRNVFRLRAHEHIDFQDINTESETLLMTEAEIHKSFYQSSEKASAARIVRRATMKSLNEFVH